MAVMAGRAPSQPAGSTSHHMTSTRTRVGVGAAPFDYAQGLFAAALAAHMDRAASWASTRCACRSGGPRSTGRSSTSTGLTVQAAYLAAWERMIGRFADEASVVGFEPINEPG